MPAEWQVPSAEAMGAACGRAGRALDAVDGATVGLVSTAPVGALPAAAESVGVVPVVVVPVVVVPVVVVPVVVVLVVVVLVVVVLVVVVEFSAFAVVGVATTWVVVVPGVAGAVLVPCPESVVVGVLAVAPASPGVDGFVAVLSAV